MAKVGRGVRAGSVGTGSVGTGGGETSGGPGVAAGGDARAAKKKLRKVERQERILGELRASPAIRISQLAEEYRVSTETIRRDLDDLSRRGMLNRTYGGASARAFAFEPALSERHKEHVEERQRVGALAARAIRPGQVLMIDVGSTTVHFARRLSAELKDLTVITNSFGVATVLSANPTIAVILCPGRYDGREGSVFGSDAVAFLDRYNANVAVISASGLTADGPNDVNPNAAAIKRAMLGRSATGLLLLDHSKYDLLTLENVCPLDEIDVLVSDQAPPAPLGRALKRAEVAVELAGEGGRGDADRLARLLQGEVPRPDAAKPAGTRRRA
ncbi:transcriptional regulator, DeoR family [Tistlia consotensis]|uniref:Transcriptional regulator, DeoR family n=1 Tax=Tistlia consotensis USBA 355 TaxID=560819 RepID=A0A1Y6BM69_9PROT|nr:DeoR/GlpR family DNA-binding transcription regulator [Tistlia consotensis]SMF19166.1 transcriptional regulator, DeoR family [Tistlia consotensis USBA 355]SNR39179.1 transcriptional regulator, DeoR family [Tistlia consotensis]